MPTLPAFLRRTAIALTFVGYATGQALAQDPGKLTDHGFALQYAGVICNDEGFKAARIGISWRLGENSGGTFHAYRTKEDFEADLNYLATQLPDKIKPAQTVIDSIWQKAEQGLKTSTQYCPAEPEA